MSVIHFTKENGLDAFLREAVSKHKTPRIISPLQSLSAKKGSQACFPLLRSQSQLLRSNSKPSSQGLVCGGLGTPAAVFFSCACVFSSNKW